MDYNFKKIENKWKKKWEEDKLFATEINSKKNFMHWTCFLILQAQVCMLVIH